MADAHRLVAASGVRSEVLSMLYRRVRSGELDAGEARRLLDALAGMRVRWLADRVTRATAWRIATERSLPDTVVAEHVAVAVLQADALIAEDPAVLAAADGLVRPAVVGELTR